jgi:hypothetical protein
MLQKTNELVRETGNIVRESGSDEAGKFLAAASERQKEAWTAFRSRRGRLALKLTLMARDATERARRLAEGGGPDDLRFVDRELLRTDRLLREANQVLGEDGRNDGEGLLAGARRLQQQAKRQRDTGHPQLALGLTRQARVMVRRALGQTDTKPAARDVEAMINTTAELVSRLEPEVRESSSRRAAELLERASNLLDEARGALQEGKMRKALRSARTASALALDVSELLERGEEE